MVAPSSALPTLSPAGMPLHPPYACWPHLPQVAESKALQRDTIQAQRELHSGQLRQLERLVEQVRVWWLFKQGQLK